MIKTIIYGDLFKHIEEYQIDSIMNAANGKGPMGAGIAGAIRRWGGVEIQRHAMNICSQQIDGVKHGDAYSTTSGKLNMRGVKRIIHAVTMEKPGGYTDYDIIDRAFKNALILAIGSNCNTMACTALGTGIGGLDPVKVADVMYPIAKDNSEIKIVFADFNHEFIDRLKELNGN